MAKMTTTKSFDKEAGGNPFGKGNPPVVGKNRKKTKNIPMGGEGKKLPIDPKTLASMKGSLAGVGK